MTTASSSSSSSRSSMSVKHVRDAEPVGERARLRAIVVADARPAGRRASSPAPADARAARSLPHRQVQFSPIFHRTVLRSRASRRPAAPVPSGRRDVAENSTWRQPGPASIEIHSADRRARSPSTPKCDTILQRRRRWRTVPAAMSSSDRSTNVPLMSFPSAFTTCAAMPTPTNGLNSPLYVGVYRTSTLNVTS